MACATGQVGLVNWLIEQDAAMVNLPDANQFTPLYHAAINGNRNTTELLNSRDAKLKTGEDEVLAGCSNGYWMMIPDTLSVFMSHRHGWFWRNGHGNGQG